MQVNVMMNQNHLQSTTSHDLLVLQLTENNKRTMQLLMISIYQIY